MLSRRGFIGLAASSLASGCLYGYIKQIPRGATRWPVFRFAAAGRLGLSHSGPPESFRFAHDAAGTIRSIREIDFALTAGGILDDSDRMSGMLAEEIAAVSGARWYPAPSPKIPIRGFFEQPSPYIVSPVDGVQVVCLARVDGTTMDSAAPFLTQALEKNEGDFFIVVLPQPVRKPDRHPERIAGSRAETLKYVLDAAPEVKIVVSTAGSPPFVHQHSGLLHVCVPPPSGFPHVVAEFTVAGHGVEILFRPACPPWVMEPERAALAAVPEAKEHDPSEPRAYVEWLEGETEAREYELR